MFNTTFRLIGNYKFLSSLLVLSFLVTTGCQRFQMNGQSAPTAENQTQPPLAPPAPVVVDGVRTSYADVVEKTSPAVVRIEAEVKARQQQQQFNLDDFFDMPGQPQNRQPQQQQEPTQRGVGSGVIVSADGTVLTNNHVVEGATKITVLLNDDQSYEAKVVGLDEASDLAVLKIEAANLPFLNLGNSDNVRIGDVVLAIGNPLGIGQTVTAGIISAKGRRTGLSDGKSFEDFLQTDAPINRGNSGGALVNLTGELIGINSQILSTTGGSIGIGFSIPSNMAKGVMEQLVANGRVRRGLLGVGIQAVNNEIKEVFSLKDTKGVLINDVKKGSAADKAGVKRDDVIIAINGETIDDTNVLRNKVAGTPPGSEIKLKIVRDGQEQELSAVLDELNPETANNRQPNGGSKPEAEKPTENGKLGVNLQPISPEIAKQLGLPEDTSGVVVSNVDQNGAAAKVQIARGDVILTINRQPVNSLEDVQAALDKAGDRSILLLIARKGQTVYLTVRPN